MVMPMDPDDDTATNVETTSATNVKTILNNKVTDLIFGYEVIVLALLGCTKAVMDKSIQDAEKARRLSKVSIEDKNILTNKIEPEKDSFEAEEISLCRGVKQDSMSGPTDPVSCDSTKYTKCNWKVYSFDGYSHDKEYNLYLRENCEENDSAVHVQCDDSERQKEACSNEDENMMKTSIKSKVENFLTPEKSRNSAVTSRENRTSVGRVRRNRNSVFTSRNNRKLPITKRRWRKVGVLTRRQWKSVSNNRKRRKSGKDVKKRTPLETDKTRRKLPLSSNNIIHFIYISTFLQNLRKGTIHTTRTVEDEQKCTSPLRLLVSDETESLKQNLEMMECGDCEDGTALENAIVEYKKKPFEAGDSEGNGKELMEQLLSQNKHFNIKTSIFVYMSPESRWHPQAIDDIPWNWLNDERWRLHTYSRYPHSANKSAILLAEAGFAYVGSGKGSDDKVICYFCCGVKQDWQSSDVILQVHKDLSPDCSMITGIGCNNVPMTVPEHGVSLFRRLQNSREVNTVASKGLSNGGEIEDDSPRDDGHQRHSLSSASPGSNRNTAFLQSARPIQMADQTVMKPSVSSSQTFGQTRSGQSSNSNISSSVTPNSNPSNSNVTVSSRTQTTASQHGNLSNSSSGTARPFSDVQNSSQNMQQLSGGPVTASSQPNAGVQNASSSTTTSSSSATTSSSSATTSSSSAVPNASNTNPQQGLESSSQNAAGETQNSNRPTGRAPTYSDLGIITERPKRYEYAVKAKRLDSFEPWPRDHHLKKEDLAEAGFYYAGYGDCARCFYCGGGLRNWEDNDNVWVEHARWFPKCAFIRQLMGQQFVDAVQDLNKDHDQISFDMVTSKMGRSAAAFQLDTKNMPLKRDPAVMTVIDMGYNEKDVFEAANFVKESCGALSADKLFEKLEQDGKPRRKKDTTEDSQTIRSSTDTSKDETLMNHLKEQNSQLRQQTVCKICMDKEVAVVFLPCGHLVSCTDCAAALKDCPVCRNPVRGIVRAFMG